MRRSNICSASDQLLLHLQLKAFSTLLHLHLYSMKINVPIWSLCCYKKGFCDKKLWNIRVLIYISFLWYVQICFIVILNLTSKKSLNRAKSKSYTLWIVQHKLLLNCTRCRVFCITSHLQYFKCCKVFLLVLLEREVVMFENILQLFRWFCHNVLIVSAAFDRCIIHSDQIDWIEKFASNNYFWASNALPAKNVRQLLPALLKRPPKLH